MSMTKSDNAVQIVHASDVSVKKEAVIIANVELACEEMEHERGETTYKDSENKNDNL